MVNESRLVYTCNVFSGEREPHVQRLIGDLWPTSRPVLSTSVCGWCQGLCPGVSWQFQTHKEPGYFFPPHLILRLVLEVVARHGSCTFYTHCRTVHVVDICITNTFVCLFVYILYILEIAPPHLNYFSLVIAQTYTCITQKCMELRYAYEVTTIHTYCISLNTLPYCEKFPSSCFVRPLGSCICSCTDLCWRK